LTRAKWRWPVLRRVPVLVRFGAFSARISEPTRWDDLPVHVDAFVADWVDGSLGARMGVEIRWIWSRDSISTQYRDIDRNISARSPAMMTLYDYGNSVCCQKVRITLVEKRLQW
jgi:hypothetical protein